MSGRDAGPSEWSSRALTRRLADYLVNAYTDGRGYDPTDLDDVEVTLRDGFDIVLGEMHEAQRDRSDGGGSEDSTTASECPATAEPPSAPVTASGEAEAEAARLRAALTDLLADMRYVVVDGVSMQAAYGASSDAARRVLAAYDNPAPVADTGHTSKACTACGHHWDVHTPFRGCFTGCSCKLDPPNQPAPVATEATQEEDGRE